VADSKRDDSPIPLSWQDSNVQDLSFNVILLSVFLGALALVGLIVTSNLLWIAPLACVAAALCVNHRTRQATRLSQVAILGAITLALLIGAGVLGGLITDASH
jgi:hypothetical protein